jgi:Tol biopolymer transport system component
VSYFPIVWNPDGQSIAFVRRHRPERRSPTGESLSLWVAAKSGDQTGPLLSWDDLGRPVSASWIAPSPDLHEVAVVPEQSQSDAQPLIVVDVGSHQSRRVAEGDLGYPTWSFDGKRLAYVKDGSEIWVTSGRSSDPGKLIWKVPEERP